MEKIWKASGKYFPRKNRIKNVSETLEKQTTMHKQIILKSFSKAEVDITKLSGKAPSNSRCAIYLSEEIYRINSFTFGERSLRDLYKLATNTETSSIEIKQPQVVDALCKFLGCEDFPDFYFKHNVASKAREELNKFNISAKKKKNIFVIVLTVLITIATIVYISIDKARWMIWQKDRYVEVDFDAKKHSVKQYKIYKEDRINNFNRIKPTCNYPFYGDDGSVNLWYGKNKNKELEYFTDLGRHPETGKTLKPITKYMIDKYICVNTE